MEESKEIVRSYNGKETTQHGLNLKKKNGIS